MARKARSFWFYASAFILFWSVGSFYRRHPSFVSSPLRFLRATFLYYHFRQQTSNNVTNLEWTRRRRLTEHDERHSSDRPLRVLYIVTSMREFDNGRRETIKDYDRFGKTMVPVLSESTHSMVTAGMDVDFYFISHYNVSEARRRELRAALPLSVLIQIWDDATPIGYALEYSVDVIREITRGLARQHRFVIKDKILDYDVFVCFEDDMLIRGAHIQHFVNVTNELFRLRYDAPKVLEPKVSARQAQSIFHGEMTFNQLSRMIPGFVRVEAVLQDYQSHNQNLYEQIPIDYDWNATRKDLHIDPSICCHVSRATSNEHIPMAPSKDDLYFWETSIDVLGVRKLPDRAAWDWVLLQAGNIEEYYGDSSYVIGDYWGGRPNHYYFGNQSRPNRAKGRYMNNQGGWMGTRRQIIEWNGHWCHGGYLPPFRKPTIPLDGLDKKSVEFWSGGLQLTGVKGCNMQRIVTLDPEGFSKHLLYHTSNNKQKSGSVRHRFSGRSIDQFWGQLNTVRKNAEAAMQKELVDQTQA